MKSELISKLNRQISAINDVSIKAHMDQGDLEEWLDEWRIETAAVSFGIYVLIYELATRKGE